MIAYLIEKKDGVAGMGYNTVRHIKSEISMALDYAVANEYINANYMSTVKINQGLCDTTRARKSKAWTDEELQETVQCCSYIHGSRSKCIDIVLR